MGQLSGTYKAANSFAAVLHCCADCEPGAYAARAAAVHRGVGASTHLSASVFCHQPLVVALPSSHQSLPRQLYYIISNCCPVPGYVVPEQLPPSLLV
jgi:hypothetical protein